MPWFLHSRKNCLKGAADMANGTNASGPYYSYEYYLDYLDLIPVDEKKLRANKHSIVIAFWVSLAAFVVLLFLILLYMSWSGSPETRNHPQHHPACPWNHFLNFPLCVRRHPQRHKGPPGAPLNPGSEKEPGRGSDPEQPLHPGGPSAVAPTPSQALPALLWELAHDGGPHSIS
ncbi:melanocortin-2 receptor accessory protein isoform X2 [Elephas maximus indicus]|uniref:melanocortin-2 receptor accessory protein isoform X2 n=1 Tax=Elephas maximus indicus TaxID=99487 RepID=UPI0021165A3A|nr:melanocortin-2 receptor accessory protein isoform X2 [Elephas maximus indicus]